MFIGSSVHTVVEAVEEVWESCCLGVYLEPEVVSVSRVGR